MNNQQYILESSADWCTVSPASGSGDGSFRISVTENPDDDRTATVTVSSTEGGVPSKTITIVQRKQGTVVNRLTARPATLSFDWDSSGQTQTITVQSNVSWSVISSATTVCTVSPASGSGNGTITVTSKGNTDTTKDITATVIISADGVSSVNVNVTVKKKQEQPEDFDSLLSNFQSILPNQVTQNSATYRYLYAAYTTAEREWTSNVIGLYSSSNFDEVYNYRGSNTEYETQSHTALHAWLMAMCLAEIVPNSGGTDNRQSQLFKKAYDLPGGSNGGRSIPLYGNFTVKGDPMVSRLVAGAVYAYNRNRYSFSDIDTMRTELGGRPIDITTTWSEIGNSYLMGYTGVNNIGYNFASNTIFPAAPGPYSSNYSRTETKHPSDQGQASDLFYPSEGNQNWYSRNYKIDVAVDNEVTSHYRLDADDSYLERTVQAVADDSEGSYHRVGEKTYYTCGSPVSGKGLRDSFVPATPTTSGAKYFDGVFSSSVTGIDVSSEVKDSSGNATTLKLFLDMLRRAGGCARKQLYDSQLGRRRPA